MTPVVVTLPYPPSANRLWRSTRRQKGQYKSEEYVQWLDLAKASIGFESIGLVRGKHRLDIAAQRPDRRPRDLDNLLKPILDALKDTKFLKGVIRDDSDTQSITIRWAGDEPVKGAAVTVCVFPEEIGARE